MRLSRTHTLSRESDALSAICDSRDLVDFEPHVPVSGPSVNRVGRLGHVNVDDTRVVDRAITHDSHLLTSSHVDSRGSSRLSGVVAADVRRSHIGDGSLGVVVVGLANIDPSRCGRSVDDERWERVYEKGQSAMRREGEGTL